MQSKEFRYYRYSREKQFRTPLFIAIEMNDVEMVKDLLSCNRIDDKEGLMNIGSGSNSRDEVSKYGEYKPKRRPRRRYFYHTYNEKKTRHGVFDDIDRFRRREKFRLNPLVERKGYYDNHGKFSHYKKRQLDLKFIYGDGEEDVNDDFDVKFRIFDIISPIEIANMVGNSEIIDVLNDVFKKLPY